MAGEGVWEGRGGGHENLTDKLDEGPRASARLAEVGQLAARIPSCCRSITWQLLKPWTSANGASLTFDLGPGSRL